MAPGTYHEIILLRIRFFDALSNLFDVLNNVFDALNNLFDAQNKLYIYFIISFSIIISYQSLLNIITILTLF